MNLCPSQQKALEWFKVAVPVGDVFTFWTPAGLGRTTVLRAMHRLTGGAYLTMKEYVERMQDRHPFQLEETFYQMTLEALQSQAYVYVDDLHFLTSVVAGCGYSYPRSNLLLAPLLTLSVYAAETGKKLIFGLQDHPPEPVALRCYSYGFYKYTPEDYRHLLLVFLGEAEAAGLDIEKIYRFAPGLNAHQLKGACVWLKAFNEAIDTEVFIDYLRSQRMVSNVDLGEVQEVDLRDLKGVDDVLESLEANLILPLENDALATELNIKPKRGVLLAGPPGTGKTTIGRAPAHRLKSKFFLIDGTFISGTRGFYEGIMQVFEAAKQNAPSIIFIDDSDVIFESGEEMGLYRYLLTMLDGLESASAGRICVMMTAMDVSNLPPALIRPGRIELWLEARPPDTRARAEILSDRLATLPPSMGTVDIDRPASATEGLTGADLKRLVEDGTILYAYDKAKGRELHAATDYFLDAVSTVRANKERYAEAESRARKQHPARPPWFDVFGGGITVSMDEEE